MVCATPCCVNIRYNLFYVFLPILLVIAQNQITDNGYTEFDIGATPRLDDDYCASGKGFLRGLPRLRLTGSAGVSAVPMAARVSQVEGRKYSPSNFLLMHAMGPNVAGVIGSAVAAGFLLLTFSN